MAEEPEYVVVYAAAYPNVAAAQAVLDTIEHLHKVAGTYDAAVIDKENGKPHVVKRMDHPHVRIIPEWFGGGALTRKELNEAAEELLADEAGLIVVARGDHRTSRRQGVYRYPQGRQARDGGDDRQDHQRTARSVQGLTSRAPIHPPWYGLPGRPRLHS